MDSIFERNETEMTPTTIVKDSENRMVDSESRMVKRMILTARIISMIFTPFYLPLLSLVALFIFSYMSRLPLGYQLKVLTLVYLFTVLLPTVLIHLYRRYQGWTSIQMGRKERRMVPYIIAIVCYFACYYLMMVMRIPQFMANVVVIALAIQVMCATINIWWKICIHMAAIGGIIGALLAISMVFQFNPLWWLSVLILVAGLVGTARMILRQHSLCQIVGGFFVGAICGFLLIL